jgi:DNA-binding transcriptional regulator YhcF (GntR family)
VLKFNIDGESPVTVFQQVKQAIMFEIMTTRLREGDRLPSIRNLAKILKLNPSTIARVYSNLEEEGFIHGRVGSGYVVKAQKSKLDPLKITMIEDEFKAFLEKAFSLGFTKTDIEALMSKLLSNENADG